MANSPSGESLISRTVRVLGALAERSSQGKSVREIARDADLPVATTYRILSELEVEDLVTRSDARGGWRHGARLWELAINGAPIEGLRAAAVAHMEDLVANLEVHISLSVLDRHEVLYIERIAPHSMTENITEVAGRLPAHATSAGSVLLAFSSPENQARFFNRNLTKFTDTTITDPDQMRRVLANIRRDGFYVAPGAIISASTGVSVPIFGEFGRAIAALTIIVPKGDASPEKYVSHLKFASAGVQRQLGINPHKGISFSRKTTPSPDAS